MLVLDTIEPTSARHVAFVLNAMAEPTRMRIINLISERPYRMSELVERLGMSQMNLAHHMTKLRQARLTVQSRQGRHVYHGLDPAIYRQSHSVDGTYGTISVGGWQVTLNQPGDD